METRALDTSQPPLLGRLSSEAQRLGSPLQGRCVFIFLSQHCEHALFSGCSVTSKRFGKPELAGSAFKMRFEDTF